MRLPRRRWRRGECRIDDREQGLGVRRLRGERSAKGARQGASFGLDIGGGSKHHSRLHQPRLRAQVQPKLATIHARRKDVDQHQIGFCSPDDPQRSLAVGSLEQAMAAVLEQGRHEAPIDGALLDDKDRGHEVRPGNPRWSVMLTSYYQYKKGENTWGRPKRGQRAAEFPRRAKEEPPLSFLQPTLGPRWDQGKPIGPQRPV